MQRTLWSGAAALLGLVLLGSFAPARALVAIMPAPPGPARAANADTIVVGRILAIEDQDVEATANAKSDVKVKYRVALMQVTDVVRGLKGAKDVKTIRVATLAAATGGPAIGGPAIRPFPRPGFGGMAMQVGNDGLFFLNKHHKENIYVADNYQSFISKDTPDFKNQVDLTRKSLKVIENPTAALQGKDSEEKLLAAGLLIQKYRQFQGPGAPKQVPIDAAESKLILNALLEGNWNAQPGRFDPNNPQSLFGQLGVTEKDGFVRPKVIRTAQDYQNAIKTWLKDNADKYRIQKYVSAAPGEPGVQPVPVPVPPDVRPVPLPINPRPPIKIQPRPIQIQPLPVQPGQPGIRLPIQRLPAQVLPVVPEVPQPLPPQQQER